jgi:hypothetical protein
VSLRGTCEVYFRFYEELNEFLPPARRKVTFAHRFVSGAPVEDWIRSLGVPREAVELILINGQSVDFSHLVRDKDRVSVYPVFESLDVGPLVRVRSRPLRRTRFAADTGLHALTQYLRLLGFDTRYQESGATDGGAEGPGGQGRVVLTRDPTLFGRAALRRGYLVRKSRPEEQLLEVLTRFDLFTAITPFRRCVRCNTSIGRDRVVRRGGRTQLRRKRRLVKRGAARRGRGRPRVHRPRQSPLWPG